MEVKKTTYNGKEIRLIVLASASKQELDTVFAFIPKCEYYDKYLIVPVNTSILQSVKEKMIEALRGKELVTNGQFFVDEKTVISRIEKAATVAELHTIYEDFKINF